MFGLIKKDLLMSKSNIKTLGIMLVVIAIMSINGYDNFAFIPAFMSVMIMMSTFSYDEYNKTDAFVVSLPNGKKNAVKAKYISTLLVIFITVIVSLMTFELIGILRNTLDTEELLGMTIGSCGAIIIVEALMYPIIYKFGLEKARVLIFVGIFGISGAASLFMKSGFQAKIPQTILTFLNNYWTIIIPLVAMIILFISYKISEHLYLRREF